MDGEFFTLKEGDNEFICLADNPYMAKNDGVLTIFISKSFSAVSKEN